AIGAGEVEISPPAIGGGAVGKDLSIVRIVGQGGAEFSDGAIVIGVINMLFRKTAMPIALAEPLAPGGPDRNDCDQRQPDREIGLAPAPRWRELQRRFECRHSQSFDKVGCMDAERNAPKGS